MFVPQQIDHFLHGHSLTDDIRLDLISVLFYSPPKLVKRIPLGVSRITLQSNRTRLWRIKLRDFLMRSLAIVAPFFITVDHFNSAVNSIVCPSSLLFAHIVPLCPFTMLRAMESPIPKPFAPRFLEGSAR